MAARRNTARPSVNSAFLDSPVAETIANFSAWVSELSMLFNAVLSGAQYYARPFERKLGNAMRIGDPQQLWRTRVQAKAASSM